MFSAWERSIAVRYLLTKRRNGGVALISLISFSAIALAVAALIITMSIMNGFRQELSSKILGFNGHAFVVGGAMTPEQRAVVIQRIRAVPGVVEAEPVIESQALGPGPDRRRRRHRARRRSRRPPRQSRSIAHSLKGPEFRETSASATTAATPSSSATSWPTPSASAPAIRSRSSRPAAATPPSARCRRARPTPSAGPSPSA